MELRKSKCIGGYLHRYIIVETLPNGVVEICKVCKDRKYFPNNISNYVYLEYHLRNALQPNHKLFKHEYEK